GFADQLIECKKCRKRYRADKVFFGTLRTEHGGPPVGTLAVEANDVTEATKLLEAEYQRLVKKKKDVGQILHGVRQALDYHSNEKQHPCPAPDCDGELAEPRKFNLMFQTTVGAMEDASSVAYLRPETAQGIFANFKNVVDSSRVKIPF